MDEPIQITALANVEVPCYLTLCDLGYSVTREITGPGPEHEVWKAERNGISLSGSGPLELLALAKLVEVRGRAWRAPDAEIDAFLSRFYPEGADDRAG